MSWTESEISQLKVLHSQGLFFSEIAEVLKRKPALVRHQARRLGLKKNTGRMGKWNSKHAHLRESVMKYFLTHSWEQTRKRFGLTESELKSLFTVAYRDPDFSHLRKDKRTRRGWSFKEKKLLLTHGGIQSRKWIAEKTGRSKVSYHTVKEELGRLGIGSKYINGIPLAWFNDIAPNLNPFTVKTKAGPSSPGVDCHFVLVPWVECWAQTKHRRNVHPTFREAFSAMAKFQRWVFEMNDDGVKRSLKKKASLK